MPLKPVCTMKKQARPIHGLIPLCTLGVVIFVFVIEMKGSLHIPLIIGVLAAGLTAWYLGWKWDEILQAMLGGINQSLEAMLILLLIGMLTSAWIASGTVPTIICYGMKLIRPSFFLPAVFILCTIISLFIGSWGAAGTIGLAFMSMGQALGVPSYAVAGAVVAGSYVGDKMSPFSDGTNMAAAVANADVLTMIRRMIPLALPVWFVSIIMYFLLGLQWKSAAEISITSLPRQLEAEFHVGLIPLLPILVLVICILLQIPSLLSILASGFTGGIIAVLVQDLSVAEVLNYMTSGYVSESGIRALDQLLSVGGIESMMHTLSIILLSMSFGGIMRSTGLMDALVMPIARHIHSAGGLICATVISCVSVNLLFPDQYLGMAIPGQMYAAEYRKYKLENAELGNVLGAGAAVTSPLVPWNNCGVYMTSVLGVKTTLYTPYAFFSYLLPLTVIIYGFVLVNRKKP